MQQALAADVRNWRQGVQTILSALAEDPQGHEPADLAARLQDKLAQVERHASTAMETDPAFTEDSTLNEHGYRLLGAYRGLSEDLIRLVAAVHKLDWHHLRQSRF